MRYEYVEKAVDWINAVNMRNKIIQQMLKNEIPPDPEKAVRLTIEIERLLEQIQNIIEL